MVFVSLGPFRGQFIGLLLEQLLSVRLINLLALGSSDTMPAPLPKLASANLCSRSILLNGVGQYYRDPAVLLTYH